MTLSAIPTPVPLGAGAPLRFELSATRTAPAAACGRLRQLIGDWGVLQDQERAQLLTTAAITAVIDHCGGSGAIRVMARLAHGQLYVRVQGPSRSAAFAQPSASSHRTRGLIAIDLLSEAWALQRTPHTLLVYFVLRSHAGEVAMRRPLLPRGE
jgi:hypothetical protein